MIIGFDASLPYFSYIKLDPSPRKVKKELDLIRKLNGSVRWCIEYRALNNVTERRVPAPLVDDCLNILAGSVLFSKLDANLQVKIKEEGLVWTV